MLKGEMRYESHRRKVYQIGIIPVIAFNSVDEALPLCKALAEGGLPAAEVTFRTACAEECIRKMRGDARDAAGRRHCPDLRAG